MDQQTDPIDQVLNESRTIAIVGLSDKPSRASQVAAHYLQGQGYRIVPINPAVAGNQILGERCYASLSEAADALAQENVQIDVVDCFRKPEHLDEIAKDAIRVKARCLWMQLGVANESAAAMARKAGLVVVMDKCMKIEHGHRMR